MDRGGSSSTKHRLQTLGPSSARVDTALRAFGEEEHVGLYVSIQCTSYKRGESSKLYWQRETRGVTCFRTLQWREAGSPIVDGPEVPELQRHRPVTAVRLGGVRGQDGVI